MYCFSYFVSSSPSPVFLLVCKKHRFLSLWEALSGVKSTLTFLNRVYGQSIGPRHGNHLVQFDSMLELTSGAEIASEQRNHKRGYYHTVLHSPCARRLQYSTASTSWNLWLACSQLSAAHPLHGLGVFGDEEVVEEDAFPQVHRESNREQELKCQESHVDGPVVPVQIMLRQAGSWKGSRKETGCMSFDRTQSTVHYSTVHSSTVQYSFLWLRDVTV